MVSVEAPGISRSMRNRFIAHQSFCGVGADGVVDAPSGCGPRRCPHIGRRSPCFAPGAPHVPRRTLAPGTSARQDDRVTTLPLLSVSDGVATIRLGRPDAGNALDLPAALALRDAVAAIAGRHDIGVVVVRAAGRLFCAGGDVRAMAAATDRPAFVAE